ncbi:MAG: ABC transporter permease [Candidatus Dormibacteraeota bacterium]|nr:ABC transporter permease [Candidatus Dormibacteraeota bacterium]
MTATSIALSAGQPRSPRASFAGAVQAELLKLRKQRLNWVMLALAVLLFGVMALGLGTSDQRQLLAKSPHTFFNNFLDIWTTTFQMGSGILLLIVAARLMGMEYSAGTLRILLARGEGRLQLLAAKLLVLLALGLLLLAGYVVLIGAYTAGTVIVLHGNLDPLRSLPAVVWQNLGLAALVQVVSIVCAVLLGTAAAVLGRSLAFAVGVAMSFYPADNFGALVLILLRSATHQSFWTKPSDVLLGANLNVLLQTLEPDHSTRTAFAVPVDHVDATHALLVIAAWAMLFLGGSIALLLRRDVNQ